MQQTLGVHIKQLRLQKNMTQADLGGRLYSKSYVSALERGNIVPSRKAILFFAEQLEQPVSSLEPLLQQAKSAKQPALADIDTLPFAPGDNITHEINALFNLVLRGTNPDILSSVHAFTTLYDENTAVFPLTNQIRYAFLKGLLAQEQGDFAHALTDLEFALALAHDGSRPIILDALGMNYFSTQHYHIARHYHQRAFNLLNEDASARRSADLLLLVELHCADDNRVLGLYREALDYYERARHHLGVTHNIKMAAQLYLGLGYSTYALLFQHTNREKMPKTPAAAEVQERNFQQAISFLVQCRSLYQASHDLLGESSARLLQAMILLDFTVFRQQQALQNASSSNIPSLINDASLLEDAKHQSRQVFITWLEALSSATPLPIEIGNILYTALAYLIRAHMQSAASARLNGFHDTAERERSLASSLCQQVLATCTQQALPLTLIREVVTSLMHNQTSLVSTLPRLPNASTIGEATTPDQFSFFNIYFAAGEVAEELGRSATTHDYAHACYTRANQSFRAALDILDSTPTCNQRDFGYITRSYLRYMQLLEQRVLLTPEMDELVRPQLSTLLKELLACMPYLSAEPESGHIGFS
jgi:transcriptional regulator with XRE-family HTH domain